MILQLGVKPSWFNTCSTTIKKRPHLIPGTPSSQKDLRSYMIGLPPIGDTVVPEMLLKVLEPYRKEGVFCSHDCFSSNHSTIGLFLPAIDILLPQAAYLMMRGQDCMLP